LGWYFALEAIYRVAGPGAVSLVTSTVSSLDPSTSSLSVAMNGILNPLESIACRYIVAPSTKLFLFNTTGILFLPKFKERGTPYVPKKSSLFGFKSTRGILPKFASISYNGVNSLSANITYVC